MTLYSHPFPKIHSSADRSGVGGNTWPKLGSLLGDGSCDTGTLHLSLVVDNDSSVVYTAISKVFNSELARLLA